MPFCRFGSASWNAKAKIVLVGVALSHKQSLTLSSLEAPAILAPKASDPETFCELTKKFIFVDIPERFQ
jgi:hypothetical protein